MKAFDVTFRTQVYGSGVGEMKCQRCLSGKEARYRVYSDVIDMKVCPGCAAEARSLGLSLELLHPGEVKKGSANNGSSSSSARGMQFVVA